jgi:hypothetical protein
VSDEWNVLVPFRANRAATLLALGADQIILGAQGELGPIDPILRLQRVVPGPSGQSTLIQDEITVEDIMAFVRFVQERAGLSDQDALSSSLGKLTDRLDALILGSTYRTHSHIRDVARRMLLSRNEPAPEQTMGTIIETLAERVYAHGHAIGLRDAEQIGLPVEQADAELDEAMWTLLNACEDDLKLLDPVDPAVAVRENDVYLEDGVLGLIESAWGVHEFAGQLEVKAQRQLPPNLQIALNVTLDVGQQIAQQVGQPDIQQAIQQAFQHAQQELLSQAQQALQEALKRQAPLAGFDIGFRGGAWRRDDD